MTDNLPTPAQPVAPFNAYPYNHPRVWRVAGDLCALKADSYSYLGHYCGYCSFAKDEIPVEWHGDYNADALGYLAIHGGITYCERVYVDPDAVQAAVHKISKEDWVYPEDASLEERVEFHKQRRAAIEAAKATFDYTHIVFGFDCAHAHDDSNAKLQDPDFIMELAATMRQQLLAYAARIEEWRAAGREQRLAILQEIVDSAPTTSGGGAGLGQMLSWMKGAPEFGPSDGDADETASQH